MFEDLMEFNRIIVTGPQRSGTRITAKIIAHDLNYKYVDERAIDIDSIYRMAEALMLDGVVIQAPALCRFVHILSRQPETLIVMVIRDLAKIKESQERILWGWETVEQIYYEDLYGAAAYETDIAKIKYMTWDQQKKIIEHWREVYYENLAGHQLWIPEEKRAGFTSSQTEI